MRNVDDQLRAAAKLGELLIDPACLVLRLERGLVSQPFQLDHAGFLRVFAFPDWPAPGSVDTRLSESRLHLELHWT
jgi:hypothetical protein